MARNLQTHGSKGKLNQNEIDIVVKYNDIDTLLSLPGAGSYFISYNTFMGGKANDYLLLVHCNIY